jgi:hypothetical protein
MQRTRFIKHGALFGILCVTAIGCGLERLGDVSTTNTSSGTTPTSTANPPTNEESEATDKTADDTSPNVSAASAASAMAKLMATAARPTTDFLSTGRIEIGLIPTNATGKLVRDGLAISADVSSHTQTAINLEQIHNSWLFKDTTAPSAHDAEECTEPDGQSGVSTSESVPEKPADPLHLAVVLDNSDCMQWTDPDATRTRSQWHSRCL